MVLFFHCGTNVKAALPNTANESNMNRCFPHHVMASVPQQGQDCKQESFSDLLSSVLSPDEATVGFEAAACVDLSGEIPTDRSNENSILTNKSY